MASSPKRRADVTMADAPIIHEGGNLTRAQLMRFLAIMGGAQSEVLPQQNGNDDHLTCKIKLADGGVLNFAFNHATACLEIWRGHAPRTISIAVDTRKRGNMIRLYKR